jgi:hypothetical protein
MRKDLFFSHFHVLRMSNGTFCLKAHTYGTNCERCKVGYYRPKGVLQSDPNPCRKCLCDSYGSLGMGRCVADEKEAALTGKVRFILFN